MLVGNAVAGTEGCEGLSQLGTLVGSDYIRVAQDTKKFHQMAPHKDGCSSVTHVLTVYKSTVQIG